MILNISQLKHVNIAIPKHLTVLNEKSKFSHDTTEDESREWPEIISKAFCELSKVKEIEAILRVVATYSHLNIMFDFHRDAIDHMDAARNDKLKVFATTTGATFTSELKDSWMLKVEIMLRLYAR